MKYSDLLHTFKTVNVNGLSFQEQNIKKIIKKWIGQVPNSQSKEDKFGNLLITLQGKGSKELMFTTHLDVVGDIGTVCINKKKMCLQIKERNKGSKHFLGNNKILGADSRAGISIILNIVKNINIKEYKKLHILFTVVEECGFQGIQHTDFNRYKKVECIISCDRPVCTWKENKGNVVNVHFKDPEIKQSSNVLKLWESAKEIGRKIIVHNAHHKSAYVGGDASFIRGYDVFDFTVGARYIHSSRETLSIKEFYTAYRVMYQFATNLLKIK